MTIKQKKLLIQCICAADYSIAEGVEFGMAQ